MSHGFAAAEAMEHLTSSCLNQYLEQGYEEGRVRQPTYERVITNIVPHPNGRHYVVAYDLVIQGLVGIMPIQGGEGPPVLMKSLVADKCTAMTAANAVLGALLHRERSGGRGHLASTPSATFTYACPSRNRAIMRTSTS